eukprot:923304-Lingulodinium_polyedra.AAC.1
MEDQWRVTGAGADAEPRIDRGPAEKRWRSIADSIEKQWCVHWAYIEDVRQSICPFWGVSYTRGWLGRFLCRKHLSLSGVASNGSMCSL